MEVTAAELSRGEQPPPRWASPGDEFLSAFRHRDLHRNMLLVGAVFTCLACAVIISSFFPSELREPLDKPSPAKVRAARETTLQQVQSSTELMRRLKEHQLWELPEGSSQVAPLFFASFPRDLDTLDVTLKKKLFLHTLLPVALLVRAEVHQERLLLLDICSRFDHPERLIFNSELPDWQNRLSDREIEFIETLAVKYRSNRAADLLARVDAVPVSLIMAQAAMESSWGSSRFTRKGNNIFGLWTWGEEGIVPAARDEGKEHKIAIYDSILDSVRAYLVTLNRLPAYRELRRLRRQTDDPLQLAEGLLPYSERRQAYVDELKRIIDYNRLHRYDRYSLQGQDRQAPDPVLQSRRL